MSVTQEVGYAPTDYPPNQVISHCHVWTFYTGRYSARVKVRVLRTRTVYGRDDVQIQTDCGSILWVEARTVARA